MTDKYVLQARELLAVEFERQGSPDSAAHYRKGRFDGWTAMTVVARVLREHAESQPTPEQEKAAMNAAFEAQRGRRSWYADDLLKLYKHHLAAIMAPKPDPLVEAMRVACKAQGLAVKHTPVEIAEHLRKALAARNLEVREASDATGE